ncbi:MAG: PEP-CTERM sorting domain-containing protein [Planctomycetota bacterium]
MRFLQLATLLFVLVSCSAANAGIMFEFGQSDYIVAPGDTIEVELFLVQDDPIGDPVDLTIDGLFSVGVNVVFDVGAPSDPAVVLGKGSIIPDPVFDDQLLGEELFFDPGVSAGFIDSVNDIFSPVTGNRIRLGRLIFETGSTPGQVTTLSAQPFFPLQDFLIAGDSSFTSLDAFVTPGTATITVDATNSALIVPEASSLSSMMLVVGLAVARRRRKDGQ